MTDTHKLAEDLRFVRGVLEQRDPAPASLFLLWAALGSVGFALVDFWPVAVKWYWLAAGPGGLLISVWIGRALALRRGRVDRREGFKWVGHWFALMIAVGIVVALAVLGILPYNVINPVALVLIALAYALAGFHLDRRLFWIAGALAGAVITVLVLPRYGWTAGAGLVVLATLGILLMGGRGGHD